MLVSQPLVVQVPVQVEHGRVPVAGGHRSGDLREPGAHHVGEVRQPSVVTVKDELGKRQKG